MVNDPFPRPILTVDVVLLALAEQGLSVGLLRRAKPPSAGKLALPGGYVHVDEDADAEAAARRVLAEKCALPNVFVEQLATFSGAKRDPRGWSATIVYYALAPKGAFAAGAGQLVFAPADAPGDLPFDHNAILRAALERLRGKGAYSSLPALLLDEAFTLAELREVYERVLGEKLNDSAFRRKMEELGALEPIDGAMSRRTARPAQLYRLKRRGLSAFDRRI
jgi:ADP-ribose pyrophosphatase YjhB (NUDIX family)